MKIEVIYEDNHLIAINKEAGVIHKQKKCATPNGAAHGD
jgi:23S rRNA-/tRNA-specific pseudouridylate synthase